MEQWITFIINDIQASTLVDVLAGVYGGFIWATIARVYEILK